jgi:hypothetical protein
MRESEQYERHCTDVRPAWSIFMQGVPPYRRNQRAFKGCNKDLSQCGDLIVVPGKGSYMTWSRAIFLAAFAIATGSRTVPAQAPVQCNAFMPLRDDAQKKAAAVRAATQHKAERKEICSLVTSFTNAEAAVVKFLEANKTWCGIPEEAVKSAKTNHEQTLKFRTMACAEAPATHPKAPTLSDAIATPSVDSATNTKTGRGTLDTLNGNPLAK